MTPGRTVGSLPVYQEPAGAVLSNKYITEGAIPFAVKDLGHTLPGICIGSAVGAALAAFQGIDCYVPHGGFIVALATNNVALFCLDIVIGSVVAAAILIAMKPTLDKQAK